MGGLEVAGAPLALFTTDGDPKRGGGDKGPFKKYLGIFPVLATSQHTPVCPSLLY